MEQFERVSYYKEHEVYVKCVHIREGWSIEEVKVKKQGTVLLPQLSHPFRFFQTEHAAETTGLDHARQFIDRILSGRVGNA